jgi:uncharacterized protein YnzC (UPF0291/DUF896 family)
VYNFVSFFSKKKTSEVAAAAKEEKRKLRAEYDQVICSVCSEGAVSLN